MTKHTDSGLRSQIVISSFHALRSDRFGQGFTRTPEARAVLDEAFKLPVEAPLVRYSDYVVP